MALIKCSECGKEISNKAEKCIHCGNPMKVKEEIETPSKPEGVYMTYDEYKESKKKNVINELSLIAKVWLIFSIVANILSALLSFIIRTFNIRTIVISIIMATAYYLLYKKTTKKNFNNILFANVLSIAITVFLVITKGMMLSTTVWDIFGALLNMGITYLVVKNNISGQEGGINVKFVIISTISVILTFFAGVALNFFA